MTSHPPGATPLRDILVVETGTGTAAAACGLILRQLGARVVKFVAPEPDGATPSAAVRAAAERAYLDVDKEVVQSTPEGGSFEDAVSRCDLLVRGVDHADSRTAALLRAEYRSLRATNPRLVFVAVTPFGLSSPFDRWSGGDLHAQAITGWPVFVGHPDEAPLVSNYGGGGLQHGLSAAAAALVAITSRDPEGVGQLVDVSGADVVGSSIRMYSHTYKLYGLDLKRAGLRAPGSSGRYPHTAFRCKDGVVSIICRAVEEWRRFIDMIGNPPWAAEPRYQDFYAMATQYPDEVDAFVRPWMLERTKAELSELAVRFKVPMAPIRGVDEVLHDEQMTYRGFFVESTVGDRSVDVPGFPGIWRYQDDTALTRENR